MKQLILSRSFGTHDGTFHADEVTACALLLFFSIIDRDKILRSRDLKALDNMEFVCDVGGVYDPAIKRFDHHQIDYKGKLSSAGMILLYLLEETIISKEVYDFLNKTVVFGVDQVDNGLVEPLYGHTSFSSIIASFVPVDYEAKKEEYDQHFHKALDFVLDFFKRIMAKFYYSQECKDLVLDEMKKMDSYLIFNRSIPWIETFFENDGNQHPAKFIIMPSHGHWKLRAIPPTYEERMQVRIPLPKEWAGFLDDDLKKITNIDGAIFCHKGRFISVWETKEDALAALKKVQQSQ